MNELHWGAEAVDPRERSLPGLKAAFLIEHAPATGRVLEIGSGDGKNLQTLRRHRPELRLSGCDVRAPGTPAVGYDFTLIDGALPRSWDGTFDAALVFDVLEHVPHPAELLADVARVLRPHGTLIAFVPIEGERLSAYRALRAVLGDDLYVETKEHVQAFSHSDVRNLFEEHFVVERVEYAYHALGHVMDASFFAAQRLRSLRRFWTNENQYYNAGKRESGGATGLFNRALRAANGLAWAESRLFRKTPLTAAGELVVATRR